MSGPPAIVAIGECMIEFSRATAEGAVWRLHYGGDTLNTATYLARLGESVAYLTALGADPYSLQMRRAWTEEGIDTSLVLHNDDRLPGLYMIQTNELGERSFHYWRQHSAARALFESEGIDAALRRAERANLLYVTGITLSLFDATKRARLIELCRSVRSNGGNVAFDPNYRPRGWDSPATAWATFESMARHVDYALPTLDDDVLLHGRSTPEECLQRWTAAGAREVVVKLGPDGAMVSEGNEAVTIPTEREAIPRDTTGAGDGFNAAYLAARRRGETPRRAAAWGNRLAGAVVKQPGAIIPRATMPLMTGLHAVTAR